MLNSPFKRLSISIEGNIGAGKSTFLSIIDESLDVQIMYEPHKKWQEIGGDNLLEKFYSDTGRWAYTFQTFAFVSRIVQQETLNRKSDQMIQILERSVFSDRYCFAKNCFEMETMTALEWKLYQEWFSWLVTMYTQPLGGFIYLKTDPEVCYKRLQKRNRKEETNVSLEYLKMIHEKHEDWLIKRKNLDDAVSTVPVLVLECNKEFETDKIEQENLMYKIHEFFNISWKRPRHEIPPRSLSL